MSMNWFCGLVLLLIVLSSPLSYAQADEVTVDLSPSSITLVPGTQGRTELILHNNSEQALNNIEVTWFTNHGVEVTSFFEPIDTLASGGWHRWDVGVEAEPDVVATVSVYFRASFAYHQEDTTTLRGDSLLATLEIIPADTLQVNELLDVQIQSIEQTLSEQQPGIIYLLVTNQSFLNLDIKAVSITGPDFVLLNPRLPDLPYALTTNNTLTIPIDLIPTDVVQPGQHLILSNVEVGWKVDHHPYQGNQVVTHTINVGVFGVSEVLQALAVPSFLLLPGFLIVTTFGLCWRLVRKTETFPLSIGQAEFWMVSITLSLLMAIAYPHLSLLTGSQRDYLEGYGFVDVFQVWCWSVVIGFFAYILITGSVMLVMRTYHQFRQHQAGRITPSAQDTPLEILKKLQRQNLGIMLPRVRLSLNGQEEFAFIVEHVEEGKETLWVVPMIELEWVGSVEQAIREAVNTQLVATGSPLLLAQVLEGAHRNGHVVVRWSSIGSLHAPCQVKREEIVSREQEAVLVSQ